MWLVRLHIPTFNGIKVPYLNYSDFVIHKLLEIKAWSTFMCARIVTGNEEKLKPYMTYLIQQICHFFPNPHKYMELVMFLCKRFSWIAKVPSVVWVSLFFIIILWYWLPFSRVHLRMVCTPIEKVSLTGNSNVTSLSFRLGFTSSSFQ